MNFRIIAVILLLPIFGYSQIIWQYPNGQEQTVVIFDDTVRCSKVEVRKWIFWKETVQVKYLVKSYQRGTVQAWYDERRRKYGRNEVIRFYYKEYGWVAN